MSENNDKRALRYNAKDMSMHICMQIIDGHTKKRLAGGAKVVLF